MTIPVDPDDEVVSVTDMYLAALLLAKGYSLSSTNRRDPNHVRFEFKCPFTEDADTSMDAAIRDYVNGVSVVVTTKYVEGLRSIKSLIYNG
jgi:hypothetical protein